MSSYILAIDQSTAATKAILFDRRAEVVGRCDINHRQISPRQGWLEHDPDEIWRNLVTAVRTVINKTGVNKKDIAALAVTNQRETSMLWDPDGHPAYNAIVWQCSRAEHIIHRPELQSQKEYITYATGLQLSPYFSAAKACWLRENCKRDGPLLFGTMDSWVIWKLTGRHVTDYSNASRTQLFNIHELKWDEKLRKLFGLDAVEMPEVCYSDQIFGITTVDGIFDEPIPVAGCMGDSHGALFAQQCWERGMGKCTFGTGGSIMMNIGTSPLLSKNRISTSIAWGMSGSVEYVFEGTIICMGDTIKWLVNELGLIKNSAQSEAYANEVGSTEGVYLVPAFTGLGTPYWQSDVRAVICGMSRFSNKYHIVRAGLESIAYQMRDIIEPMERDAGTALENLRVDGGPTGNAFLMQFVADILEANLMKNSVEELSALGAAFAGGMAVGFFAGREDIATLYKTDATYRHQMPAGQVRDLYDGWKAYVNMLIAGPGGR